ncbi:MAG: arylsulfatase family protein [Frankiales bacterium]|nr:arylsulfatase family protein [Frankiales bacterium]
MTQPYEGFQGTVGRTVAGSTPYWPPRKQSRGKPNVVVVLCDDVGFADIGCYGSEIATPHLDALAARGLRFTNFHVTPMCSPTRAALLTGLNPHAVGVGHVAHSDPGFPGYAMELSDNVVTTAEVLRDNGYATLMVGKWHLAKDSDCSDAGPMHSWPCQRGFDRFYGFLDGFTNLHQPHRLLQDNTAVDVDSYPPDYYLTDDLTDHAISMMKATKASDPSKPFFLYFAHGAVHAPLHAKAADIEKYKDRYAEGWDVLRAERFARQQSLGVLPDGVELPPRNSERGNDVVPWDSLPADKQELFARYMAVYAGMVDSIDQQFGRLVAALEELDELDNTIILFTSDNGASREGEEEGTTAYYQHLLGNTDTAADLARLDEIGGPTTMPHYPRGWAMASGTPFRLYKINTHAGGHSVPMILTGPDIAPGEVRRQFAHVTDVLPTLLDLLDLQRPTERQGKPLKPLAGASFGPAIASPEAASTHPEQHYEMVGHRGYYRDGWEIVTLHQPLTPIAESEWELYDLVSDPTEMRDLAAEHPEKVAELSALWEQAARENQVYPIDEGAGVKFLVRPERSDVFSEPVTILPGTPTLERWRSQQLIANRSFRVTVSIHEWGTGTLVAHGDQGGGYVLYVSYGEVCLAHNDGRGHTKLVAGAVDSASVVEAVFTAPGGGTWSVVLLADGVEVGAGEGLTLLFPMAPFQGIDVGIDRKSPVVWERGPSPFTGTIDRVTYLPGALAPDSPAAILPMLRELGATFE